VLPECESLVFSAHSEALHDLRSLQDRRQAIAAQQAAAAGSSSSAAAAHPKGLMLCSKEWVGLDLQHTGSWQLSLVYTSEQLKMFSQVGAQRMPIWCGFFKLPTILPFLHTLKFVAIGVPATPFVP
jgi:hypothetical protein